MIVGLLKRFQNKVLGRLREGFNRPPSPSVPNFLIVGVQKGGTTSLYEYLQQHPQVQSALTKEVHFFDLNFDRSWEWYRQQLGLEIEHNVGDSLDEFPIVTGEASPYYFFHPLVPKRVFQTAPGTKIIVLLRDPVARSLSHYHHERRWQFEPLSLEDALIEEDRRLRNELEKFERNTNYQSYAYQHHSYRKRGRYLEQLKAWQRYFSPNQILVIQSEFFDQNSDEILQKTLDFLELSPFQFSTQERYNSGKYPEAPESIKQWLAAEFSGPNRQLLAHLEQNWPAENLLGFGPGEVNWLTPTY